MGIMKKTTARNWSAYTVTSADRIRFSKVFKTLSRITMSCLGVVFKIKFERDKEFENGRMYLQVYYECPCTKTGKVGEWTGRKFYLSKHMTQDEIVKTAYVAFKAAIKHEIMEGFKVDGKILFNPHINFEELLNISHKEITRA